MNIPKDMKIIHVMEFKRNKVRNKNLRKAFKEMKK